MTVKELKKALEQFPDDMQVFIAERKTEYAYGLANSVREQEVIFDPNDDFENGEEPARENVVVIDEA